MPRDLRGRAFVVTLNNPEPSDKYAFLGIECQYAIVGEERGQGGTEHLQAYICFDRAVPARRVRDVLPRAHIEAAKGSAQQNKVYCSKDGCFEETGHLPKQGARSDLASAVADRVSGKSEEGMLMDHGGTWVRCRNAVIRCAEAVKNEQRIAARRANYENVQLRPWQVTVLAAMEKQTDRHIQFVVDQKGGQGKSWLGNYLVATRGAIKFETTALKDCVFAYGYEPIVVFDMTRTQTEYGLNYGTIEAFKGESVFSQKYDSQIKLLNCCKVVVMMNEQPLDWKLSADRYVLHLLK